MNCEDVAVGFPVCVGIASLCTGVIVGTSTGLGRRIVSAFLLVLLGVLVAAAPVYAATERIDATTTNTTFAPSPWSVSTPTGLPAPGHFGGSVFFSTTTNATATFAFEGTGIAIVYAKWGNRGIAGVSVDGGPETLVDMYAPGSGSLATVQPQQVTQIASGLTNGPHTVTIRVTGTRNPASTDNLINIDAYDVTTPDPPVYSTPASSTWSIAVGALLALGVALVVSRRRTA
jgi:hypothetical protein